MKLLITGILGCFALLVGASLVRAYKLNVEWLPEIVGALTFLVALAVLAPAPLNQLANSILALPLTAWRACAKILARFKR